MTKGDKELNAMTIPHFTKAPPKALQIQSTTSASNPTEVYNGRVQSDHGLVAMLIVHSSLSFL